jgi:AcrR family transcriptional regulator
MGMTLRERRRATAVGEIIDEALAQIAVQGPAGLSVRSVARSLGMTVQALYHYFPSRDDLVTALITRSYDDLVAAVQQSRPGFAAAAEGFREWALTNPSRFQLIYGTPLLHYAAPVDGATTEAARRLAEVFVQELFGEFTTEQLGRTEFAPLSQPLPAGVFGGLPEPAAALFVSAWGHMHGLVTLEVFGHTAFIAPLPGEIFRAAMHDLVADARRRIG